MSRYYNNGKGVWGNRPESIPTGPRRFQDRGRRESFPSHRFQVEEDTDARCGDEGRVDDSLHTKYDRLVEKLYSLSTQVESLQVARDHGSARPPRWGEEDGDASGQWFRRRVGPGGERVRNPSMGEELPMEDRVIPITPPLIFIALGLDNGCIYCIQGDIACEQIKRFKLEVQNGQPGKIHSPITGIGFRVDGQPFQLFAVTPSTVSLFKVEAQTPTAQTLDYIGSEVGSVAMTDRSELIIGRPEAVYFYEIDGRGPCWAFEGEKKLVGWFRGYLLCVISDQRTGKYTFNIYDLKNRLIAHSIAVQEVSHMLCEWGNILLIMADKSALLVVEKDMESKLDMLFKKNLYPVAINLVQSQQADVVATAEGQFFFCSRGTISFHINEED